MIDPSSCTCSEVHTRAICDDVGERFRILLDRSGDASAAENTNLVCTA
jgi:hypothetical protein